MLPILVLLIAALIFIGLKNSKFEKKTVKKPEKVWRVNTLQVEFNSLSPEVILYGRVETPNKATLKAALIADVISVNVLEGSKVEAGQVLVSLDDTDVKLLLEQRQADLAEVNALINAENERFKRDKNLLAQEKELLKLADNAVTRAKKLEKTRLTSQSSLDDAVASKYRQALTLKRLEFDIVEHPARLAQLNARKARSQALVKQAHVDIQRTQITAPFSGIISSLVISIGDRVRAGDSLLSLYDTNKLEVRAQIPGRYTHQVRNMLNHDEELVAIGTVNTQIIPLSLDRLSGEVKVDSGGIEGLFSLIKKEDSLALGEFVELKLKLRLQDNVIALPFNALYALNHVYKLSDAHLQLVAVDRIGEYTNEAGDKQLLVRSSELQQGDQVVSTQLPNATTGLRVEAVSE